jgi:hypothetical protein
MGIGVMNFSVTSLVGNYADHLAEAGLQPKEPCSSRSFAPPSTPGTPTVLETELCITIGKPAYRGSGRQ